MTHAANAPLLRDIDPETFAGIYNADRFTTAVIANRYRYVVRQMCSNLLHNAFSPILRDWYDFAAIVAGPPELNYPTCAVSNSLMLFSGTMCDAVRNVVEEYGPENLEPGDVLMVNDPYRAGTHVNDLCFIRPVFDGGRILSFLVMRAHQLDMGGVTPAGFSGTKRNVFETGLVVPPMLLYRRDEPIKPAFNLIFDNSRFGALLLPDIKSLHKCLLVGERLIRESAARYGCEAMLGAMRYACDTSAEALATAIETKVPDGIYRAEEFLDADGVDDSLSYRISLTLRKVGRNLEIDFSGTSRQARTSINCGPLDVKSSVGTALKMLLDPSTPFTSGTYRNVDIVLPPGTLLSATPPDGPIFLFWEASAPVLSAVYRALGSALGVDAVAGDCGSPLTHNGTGTYPDGRTWVAVGQVGGEHGPWGATREGDGDSYQVSQMMNNIDPPAETAELDAPIVLMRREYVADTGGAGTNRGGAAVLKDTLWLSDATHESMPLHVKTAPGFGVNGGQDGALAGCWMFSPEDANVARGKRQVSLDTDSYAKAQPIGGVMDPDSGLLDPSGRYYYFGAIPTLRTQPNAVFRYRTGGGGGWGDPLARDPDRVKRDVRDEYVTIEGALRDYGVVVLGDPRNDPENLKIDHEATEAARSRMRRQRESKAMEAAE